MTTKFNITIADITTIKATAIVNSANTTLQKGSGMCKTIYEKAGEAQLNAYLQGQENLKPGAAIITPGFNLPAQYIIHTVTPKYFLQNDAKHAQFASCYVSILKAAIYYHMKTIAIPCLGIGHHGWPLEEAAKIAVDTLQWYLSKQQATEIEEIIFVCFDKKQAATYSSILGK